MKAVPFSLVCLLVVFGIAPGVSVAEPTPAPAPELAPNLPPEVVANGFAALVKNGTLSAIDTWLAGSVRETDDQFQDAAAARMNACAATLGRVIGHEILRVVPLTRSTRRVYAIAKFEKGVGWMSFDCYRPGQDWTVVRFNFNTNPEVVLTPGLLSGFGLRGSTP